MCLTLTGWPFEGATNTWKHGKRLKACENIFCFATNIVLFRRWVLCANMFFSRFPLKEVNNIFCCLFHFPFVESQCFMLTLQNKDMRQKSPLMRQTVDHLLRQKGGLLWAWGTFTVTQGTINVPFNNHSCDVPSPQLSVGDVEKYLANPRPDSHVEEFHTLTLIDPHVVDPTLKRV